MTTDAKQNKTIIVELIRSVIGVNKKHRATLIGLGLRAKRNAKSELIDTEAVRGMIHQVRYLVKIVSEAK
jgi:large subunit ribosomal protein L30